MRTLSALVLTAALACGQTISTRTISPATPTRIELSPQLTTTLLFPEPLSGVFGLGLVSNSGSQAGGVVQVEHPDGSNLLVLHALSENSRVIATVLMSGVLYVLDIASGPQPDVAVTLTKSGSLGSPGTPQTITPQQVVANRPKYDPELLVGFLRRARDASLLKKLYPGLYEGYSCLNVNFTSDSGSVKTTVTKVHRFAKDDVTVLEGTVQNEASIPLKFDGRVATVEVGNEIEPVKLFDCLRPIPVGATVPVSVVLEGDYDGSRSNISIENTFRLILPEPDGLKTVWSMKNGQAPGQDFFVPTPTPAKPSPPLTQAQNKEKQ